MKNIKVNSFTYYFFSLNPYELSILANVIGILFSIPITNNQRNTLGNFLELIGQQILLIQAQFVNVSSNNIDINEIYSYLNKINFKLEYIEEIYKYIKDLLSNGFE